MPDAGASPLEPAQRPKRPSLPFGSVGAVIKKRWRGWLRAIHRDVGYLCVGLTVIYALSGLAINHIKDWDPNFKTAEREHQVAPIPASVSDEEATRQVLAAVGVSEKPREAYRVADTQLEIYLDNRTLIVETDTGKVFDNGQEPRFFLRVANWLHYNRGKAAWTYVADAYAVLLLYLAVSGIFMLKGRLGLRWRGAIVIAIGAAVPLLYVILSGGPGSAGGS